jgi:hypothetical protein
MRCSGSPSRVALTDVHLLRAALLLLCGGTLSVLGAAPAAASCASGSPDPSPYAFLGTVIRTSEGGRVAEVVTDDGATVTVRGTQDTSWFSHSYSSVDRRYALGGRYDFHPINDDSPYSDNACTATREISGPPLSAFPPPPTPAEVLPAWLPVDEQAGPLGYVLFFGPVVGGAGVVFALLRGLHRRRRTDPSAS